MEKNFNKVAREIKRIYKETDVRMKDIQKVCEIGCSYCCHQVIPVHHAEELPITKFIKDNLDDGLIEDIKNNIISWLDYFDANTPDNKVLDEQDLAVFAEKHVTDFIPCPFLINDQCSIYQTRPLVCRTFSVNDDSSLCRMQPNRMGDEKGYILQKSKFDQIIEVSDFVGTRYLSYAVADSLGIDRQLKPIKINLIPELYK